MVVIRIEPYCDLGTRFLYHAGFSSTIVLHGRLARLVHSDLLPSQVRCSTGEATPRARGERRRRKLT